MARHGGVTFKSKKYGGNTLHKSDVLPEQFLAVAGRRRQHPKAASSCKWTDKRNSRSRRGKTLKKPEWL